jgi:hypothetical protein
MAANVLLRHGHLPEREVMTGIGPVAVRQPRVRDREVAAGDPGRIRFTPEILPPSRLRRDSGTEARADGCIRSTSGWVS